MTEMSALLAAIERRIREVAEPSTDHPVQQTVAAAVLGGKRLRPRLLAAVAGPDADPELVVDVAVSIELLHAALLIHDDVIDGDDERRGVPSVASRAAAQSQLAGGTDAVSARLGLAAAIVSGDALIVRALTLLGAVNAPKPVRGELLRIVDRAMIRAAEGEYDDVAWAGRAPGHDVIDGILRGKTADYSFRAPIELGAVLGGLDEDIVRELGEIGLRMGVAYQLRDDVLGVFGDPSETGKSALTDIRTGSPTLLASLSRVHPQWQSVAQYYGDPDADDAVAARIRAVMHDTGALGEVEARIRSLRDEVVTRLEAVDIEPSLRAELTVLFDRCTERTR